MGNLLHDYSVKLGSNGGRAAAESLTKKKRIERAKKAVAARAAKRKRGSQ
jgi:hypothetical protein